MDIIYKREQLAHLASKLSISKVQVSTVWELYVQKLQDEIDRGNTVKFFNICYILVGGKPLETSKTLAYIAHEIADELNMGKDVVFTILLSYEEYLIRGLRKCYYYSIRGLVGLRIVSSNGCYRVKVKKSKVYEGRDIKIRVLSSFRRKVEGRVLIPYSSPLAEISEDTHEADYDKGIEVDYEEGDDSDSAVLDIGDFFMEG